MTSLDERDVSVTPHPRQGGYIHLESRGKVPPGSLHPETRASRTAGCTRIVRFPPGVEKVSSCFYVGLGNRDKGNGSWEEAMKIKSLTGRW